LRNLNFAIVMAAYLLGIFWIFTRTGRVEAFLIFAIAASPVALFAFVVQGRWVQQKPVGEAKQNPVFSHLMALAACAGLFLFVRGMSGRVGISTTSTKRTILFFGDYVSGWTTGEAVQVLAISLVMAASAMVVWTSYRFTSSKNVFVRNVMSRVFFAGASESARFFIYLYIFATAWCMGAAAVLLGWDSAVLNLVIIRFGRAMLPLAVLLVVAMLRLPVMGIGFIASLGAMLYLLLMNTSPARAGVFLGIPLAFFGAYFLLSALVENSAVKSAAAGPAAGLQEQAAGVESGEGPENEDETEEKGSAAEEEDGEDSDEK